MHVQVADGLPSGSAVIDADVVARGIELGLKLLFATSSSANIASRSDGEASKNDVTCRTGITSVCPGVTGYASRTTTAASFRNIGRLAGRVQNGHMESGLMPEGYKTCLRIPQIARSDLEVRESAAIPVAWLGVVVR